MLARQSLGVPGTASFLPFGAMIFPCFFPFMYRHPLLTNVRTKTVTSLLLLYRILIAGTGATAGTGPIRVTWSPSLRPDSPPQQPVHERQSYWH